MLELEVDFYSKQQQQMCVAKLEAAKLRIKEGLGHIRIVSRVVHSLLGSS